MLKHRTLIAGLTAAWLGAGAFSAEPPLPRFRSVDVDTHVEIGYGVAVADVDGDGRPDILLVDKSQIVWYQNPSWQKHVIVEKLTESDNVCIAAQDINGDGKAEIAVGAGWNPSDTVNSGTVFYLIPPADRTQRWEPVVLPHEPTVHRMRWVRNQSGKFDLVVVPLHGRGNKAGVGAGARALAYHIPADPKQPWTTEVIEDFMHLSHNFQPVHWTDREADDLLIAGKEGVFHMVHHPEGWKRAQLVGNAPGETNFVGAGEVRVGKLAAEQPFVATIEPMHGTQLAIYTIPSSGTATGLWKRTLLDDSLVDGHALGCADFIGIGRDQIVAGWRAMGKADTKVGIRIYTPLDASGKTWRTTLLDDNSMACEDLCLADLNGDGKMDIVASGRATHNLKIYFNEAGR